jgi:hypothetical protein
VEGHVLGCVLEPILIQLVSAKINAQKNQTFYLSLFNSILEPEQTRIIVRKNVGLQFFDGV